MGLGRTEVAAPAAGGRTGAAVLPEKGAEFWCHIRKQINEPDIFQNIKKNDQKTYFKMSKKFNLALRCIYSLYQKHVSKC
jgi:hypothetical protein